MPNFTSQNTQIAVIINRILLIVFCFISIIWILQRIDQFLRIKAIDDCAKISRYEKQLPEENAKVLTPYTNIYKSCLKDKGY